MINLKGADGAKLQLVTSASADIDVHVSWIDYTSSGVTFLADYTDTTIPTGTTTDITAAPSSGVTRNCTSVFMRNRHASTSNTLTLKHYNGTTGYEIYKFTLAAGECALVNEMGVLFVYDTNGNVKTGSPAASDTAQGILAIATQADQESSTSTVLAVTPGRQQYHPSSCKFWVNVTGAGSPAIAASYNVTSVADTNTGRMTVTIATDFSSANWSLGGSGVGSTTVTSAAIQWGVSKAAGTIEIDNSDLSATPVVEDPTVGYDVQGFGDQ